MKLLYFSFIPSKATSVPITVVPQANVSIHLTFTPAPKCNGAIKALALLIIGYGFSTNPKYSIFRSRISCFNSKERPPPMIFIEHVRLYVL